jgi:Carboxypeptidase regulatory-like domain/Domain of unknown function (DUF4129)
LPYILLVRALLLLLTTAWAAEPVIHVKARTRIDVLSVVRVPGGIVLRGALVDTALEERIPGHPVAVSIDGPNGFYRYAEPTSDDGTFRWRVPLPLGEYSLRLNAGGDDEYAPAPLVERILDIGRRTPTLTLAAPRLVSVRDETVNVVVELKDPPDELAAPDEELEAPVVVLADGKPLARRNTRAGRLELALQVHALGKAGQTVTLSARFDGDPLRNPAQASQPVLLTSPTTLTLAADPDRAAADEDVSFGGLLTDLDGPVAEGVVDVEMGRQVVGSGITERDGRFLVKVRGADLGMGRITVGARFRARGFREASQAPSVTLTVHSASWRMSPAYGVPPLLTALVLAGLALRRRRPWEAVVARWRARTVPPAPQSGLSEGRTRLLKTLRPAGDFGLAGQVCDSATLSPIAAATLVVDVGGERRSAVTDGDGRFALEALPAGTLAVEVAAAGYVSERFHRTVPHRGELRGARVLLVPIRARIFAAYDRAARPLAPRPEQTEIWTPREILAHVRGKQLITEDLQRLTSAVETSCYGPRAPDLEALAQVEALVERVKPAAR